MVLSILCLKLYPYVRYHSPIGLDSGAYLLYLFTIQQHPNLFFTGANIGELLSYGLTLAPIDIFGFLGVPWDTVLVADSIFLAVVYALSNYILVSVESDRFTALLTIVISGFSLTGLVLTGTLLQNAMGLSLLTLTFACYLKYLKQARRIYAVGVSLLMLLMLLQDQIMLLTFMGVIAIFILAHLPPIGPKGLSLGRLKQLLMPFFIPVAFLIIAVVLFATNLLSQSLPFNVLSYTSSTLALYGAGVNFSSLLPTYWVSLYDMSFYSFFTDNFLILILASVGLFGTLVALGKSKSGTSFRYLLVSWYAFVTITVFLAGTEGYRQIINYPIPILAAMGSVWLLQLVLAKAPQGVVKISE